MLLRDLSHHSRRNRGYAGGGRPLGNFERVAKMMSSFKKFPYNTPKGVAAFLMLKQLDSIFWDWEQRRPLNPRREEHEQDLTVYSVIIRCAEMEEK